MSITQARSLATNRVVLEADLRKAKELFASKQENEGLRLLKSLFKCDISSIAAEASYLMGKYYKDREIGSLEKQLEYFQVALSKGYQQAKPELSSILFKLGFKDLVNNSPKATAYLSQAAELKLSQAQYWLARRYMSGIGIQADAKNAIKLFENAAEYKHADAANWLGNVHKAGQVVPSDSKKAVAYYRQAVDLQSPNAMQNLANCYIDGFGVPQDKEEAKKLLLTAEAKLKKDIELYQRKCEHIEWTLEQKSISKDKVTANQIVDSKYINNPSINNWLESTVYGDAKELFLQAGILYLDKNHPNYKPNLALQYLERSANLGDASAEYEIGKYYLQELGGIVSPDVAVIHFEKAAKMFHPDAFYALANIFKKGQGTVKADPKKAVEYYIQGDLRNHLESSYELGLIYLDGLLDVEVDKKRGIALITKAASVNNRKAQQTLACIYKEADGVDINLVESKKWYMRAIESPTTPDILLNAGRFFCDVYADPKQGEDLLRQAANQGLVQARYALGVRYILGQGLEKNISQGIQILEKCAEQPSELFGRQAARVLSSMFSKGKVVQKDPKKAFFYKKLAAENGDVASQNILGEFYRDGFGVEKDEKQATEWYRKGAQNGDMYSEFCFADRCLQGIGVQKDEKTGIEFLKKSAEHGMQNAQINLSMAFAKGEYGLDRDEKKAEFWFEQAINNKMHCNANSSVINNIALSYLRGWGTKHNIEKAIALYKISSEKYNSAYAQYSLGIIYKTKNLGVHDEKLAVEWFSKGAQNNHSLSQRQLAMAYNNGKGVVKDDKQSTGWLQKAAQNGGDMVAEFLFADRCLKGVGIQKDEKTGIEFLRKAAEHGVQYAQINLSIVFSDGIYGLAKDEEQAKFWFEKAINNKTNCYLNPQAMESIAFSYANGKGTKSNIEKAIELYKTCSEKYNSASAQYALGMIYQNKNLRVYNEKLAVEWFSKAAKNNHSISQRQLAMAYDDGRGVIEDDKQATEWFQKAAQNGDRIAEFFFADRCLNGIGTQKDEKTGIEFLKKAAEHGVQNAQINLSIAFADGMHGLAKDEELAKFWFEKAINDKTDCNVNPQAMQNIAFSYASGKGTKSDIEKAIELYKICSEKYNSTHAQYSLGMIYLNENYGVHNEKLAVEWLEKAAKQNHLESKTLLQSIRDEQAILAVPKNKSADIKVEANKTPVSLSAPISKDLIELALLLDLKEDQVKKLRAAAEFLDFDAIAILKNRAASLNSLLDKEEKELATTEKMQTICQHPQMKDYYQIFYRCLSAIILACTVLQSGKLDDTTSSKAGCLADAIDFIGGQIPGVSIGVKILTKLIRFGDARNKQAYLNMITKSFSDMEKNPEIIGELARQITEQQKEDLEKLAAKDSTRWEAFKQLLASLKDSLQGSDIDNPVKKLAEAHSEVLLNKIAENKLKLTSPHDKNEVKAFIKNCIVTVLGKLVIEQSVTINVRVVAEPGTPPSPTLQSAPRSQTPSSENKSLNASQDATDKTGNSAQILQDLQADIAGLKGMRSDLADMKKSLEDLGVTGGGNQVQMQAVRSPTAAANPLSLQHQTEQLERHTYQISELQAFMLIRDAKSEDQAKRIAELEARLAAQEEQAKHNKNTCVVS